MSDLLLRFASSALLGSVALAALATWVQSRGKQPRLAHFLWLLVLLKLLVPTWVGVPMPAFMQANTPALTNLEGVLPVSDVRLAAVGESLSMPEFALQPDFDSVQQEAASFNWQASLLWLWAIGSSVVLVVSTARVFAFHRMLRRAATPVASRTRQKVRELAKAMQLRRLPRVLQVDSNLSPMLWWVGGKPTVVLPAQLLETGYSEELRWALAHELGHMKRRDHWVRWVEWLAVVLFWWNPVSWWARRNLRVHEEICCDRLVLEALRPNPKTYASSLLNVVEFLARPKHRPPALASAMNSGGAFEQRLQMILNHNNSRGSRWLRAFSILAAAAVLPVGFAAAQQGDARDRPDAAEQEPASERKLTVEQYRRYAEHIKIAVAEGEITREDAEQKLAALLAMTVTFTPAETRNPFQEPAQKQSKKDARVAEYRKLVAQLKSAVDSGLMTMEEAELTMAKAADRLRAQQVADAADSQNPPKLRMSDERYRQAAAMLAEAVAAGDLTREQAGEKLAKIREETDRRLDPRVLEREEYALSVADTKRLLELGYISEEGAQAKIDSLSIKPRTDGFSDSLRRSSSDHFYMQLELDIKSAVADGVMTAEEGRRLLEETKASRDIAEADSVQRKAEYLKRVQEVEERDRATVEQRVALMKRYEQLQAELQAAVETEAMSAETAARVLAEAQAALQQAEANLEQAERRNAELEDIRRQLEEREVIEERELIEEEPLEEVVEEPIESEIDVYFSVASTGKLTFRGQEMSLDKVSNLVKEVSKRGRTHVILSCDEGPTYQDMTRIIDSIVASGAGEVSIARSESSDG